MVEVVVPILKEIREAAAEGGQDSSEEEDARQEANAHGPVADDLGIHPTHVVLRRGLWTWCLRCGSHSQGDRYKLLRRVCEPGRGLSGAGKQALRGIAKGHTPNAANPLWGDEG